MADKSFNDTITEVKLAYNLVEYIEQSGIQLKRRGNKAQGLCPFHNEKTPSFNVDETSQYYRCYGCGAHGDIFAFVENYENLTFFDSLKKLADDKNITVKVSGKNDSGVDYQSLRACIREVANFYHAQFRTLDENHPAKQQILSRGLTLKGMTYGYAPEGYDSAYKHLSAKGYTDETILAVGVVRKSEKSGRFFDFWQGRLMFYITDTAGKVIGFSGRKLFDSDKMGKYVNSSDSYLFNKSTSLFNIAGAKKQAVAEKTIYIAEGQFDVAALVESGLTNAVAASGTAFTPQQGSICRRLVTESGKIVFCFDGDDAGIAAALKVFQNVPELHAQAYVVNFPKNQDPCDYRQANGSEGLVDLLTTRPTPLIEFVLDRLAQGFDMDSVIERDKYIREAAHALNSLNSRALRESYTSRVALDSYSSVETVREAIESVKKDKKKNPERNAEFAEGFVNGTKHRTHSTRHGSDKFDTVLHTTDSMVDVTEAYVPEYEAIIDSEDIIRKMKDLDNSPEYGMIARLVRLVTLDRGLATYLHKVSGIFPSDVEWLAENINTHDDKPRLIPELFDSKEVMTFILTDPELFPMVHLMNRQTTTAQFNYLARRLLQLTLSREQERIQRGFLKVLSDSSRTDVDILERALAQEKERVDKLHEKYAQYAVEAVFEESEEN